MPGKLRRAVLAQFIGADALGVAAERRSPAAPLADSPLESALAALWSQLLDVDAVGPDDDFLLLDGDSLGGARLLAQIRDLFGIELPLTALFGKAATIAGMAHEIERARAR